MNDVDLGVPLCVCISLDDNYIKPALVMLDSLFINNSHHNICIYVLYAKDDLSKANKVRIRLLAEKCKQSAKFISVKKDLFAGFPTDTYISIATYYRLLIFALLPPKIKLILYLDVDLVVCGDLGELFNINMDKWAYAGVGNKFADRKKVLGIPSQYHYINAGVLLINLQWLRKFSSTSQIFSYIRLNLSKLVLADQDAINGLYYKNIRHIPLKYNFYPCNLLNYSFWQRVRPVIFHYYGRIKPWHDNYNSLGKDIYWHYVNKNIKLCSTFKKYSNLIKSKIINLKIFWSCISSG